MNNVDAIVVTYNRCTLLKQCLLALATQSTRPRKIWVIDNASTDNTPETVLDIVRAYPDLIEYRRLADNLGGAGGFSEGLKVACEGGCDWAWMMDDDAAPYPDALEQLIAVADDNRHIYGSLAVRGDDTSWATTILAPDRLVANRRDEVPVKAQVLSLPFLGFMVHRDLVTRIGLPDPGYFIAADDVEYCLRAERSGAKLFIAGKSLIDHPKSDRYIARLPGRELICLRLPPWKRYYDTRNRLLIARKYYGFRLLTQTVPGSLARHLACLGHEGNRLRQTWAFLAGFIDGLLGLKGRRHRSWGISQ
ncbi:MAG TPA: glycosyltransferase family 2 protein [Dyella sp.]|uniref:glycosyltransferase family 2 protein n=1 Tax=Dyella sp. TaxID=1869338 RepID=UPI002F92DBAB